MDLSKAKWRTSSHSTGNGGNCVEVAAAALVAVRDSKDPHGPVLSFTAQRWAAFTDRLKTAARDLAPAAPAHWGSRVPMNKGKLVRDKIPQTIGSKGLEPVINTPSTPSSTTSHDRGALCAV